MKNYLKIAGNIHLSYYIEAADILNIPYEIVIYALTARFGNMNNHWYINTTAVPVNNAPSSKLARSKYLTSKLLSQAGISVPYQEKLKSEEDAISLYNKYNSIVIKPNQNLGGNGVTILPQSETEAVNAYKLARTKDKQEMVLGEQYVSGEHFRVLVLDDTVIGVVKREFPKVIGDGISSINQLIAIANQKRKEKFLKPIAVDIETDNYLKRQNLTYQSVPTLEQTVYLRGNANISKGATTHEYSDKLPEVFKQKAIQAAKILDLKLAGVDMIIPDLNSSTYYINEVNYNPGLRIHYKTDYGEPKMVAVDIMKYINKVYSK